VVCRFGLALGQQQESADLAARRRAAALLGLGGLLATRMALRRLGCVLVILRVAVWVRKGEFCAPQKFHKLHVGQ
jgi:hypothetical protein